MVKTQLRNAGIRNEQVLAAFLKVPRHRFVPTPLLDQAYEDRPLSIGSGQTISQPYIVAYMTESLEINPNDCVLEVGTGSGYQTAILAELCKEVCTVEILPDLSASAQNRLNDLGYSNIRFKIGSGIEGWVAQNPFEKILVAAAAPRQIPEALWKQLGEGGRMVIPVAQRDETQTLMVCQKDRGKIQVLKTLPVRFVPLVTPADERKEL